MEQEIREALEKPNFDKYTLKVNKRIILKRVPFHKAAWQLQQLQSQVRGLSIEQDLTGEAQHDGVEQRGDIGDSAGERVECDCC